MSDIDGEDVQKTREAADEEFERKTDEIEDQVDSITEKVNEALDRDNEDPPDQAKEVGDGP